MRENCPDLRRVTSRLSALAFAAGLTLLISACGGTSQADGAATNDTTPDLAFSDDAQASVTLVEPDRSFDLSEEDQALVSFEADWVCLVQQQTFDSDSAITEALEGRLAEADISEQVYGDFRQAINQNQELRAAIMQDYQSNCRP